MPKIKKPEKEINISVNNKIEYPIFSFKYLQQHSYNKCKDVKFFIDFTERLKKLSELGWNEIGKSQKHSFGWEKIPIKQIKPDLPRFITPDIEHLIAFRATGNNLPFLGLRENNIFHIIFIETKFNDIYNH